MVGSRNGNGIDILVFEKPTIVRVFLWRGSRLLHSKIHVAFFQVTNGYGFLVAILQKSIMYLIASIAETDVAHAEFVVRSRNFGVAERCHRSDISRFPPCHFPHYILGS